LPEPSRLLPDEDKDELLGLRNRKGFRDDFDALKLPNLNNP